MVGIVGGGAVQGIPQTSSWENKKCLFLSCLVCVSLFQYGLDTGLVNGFQALQGFLAVYGNYNPTRKLYVIETVFQQLITSLLTIGLAVVSILIGPFSRYYGRRAGFVVCSLINFVGTTIQILVTSKGPIYLGRFLLGLGNGGYCNLALLWLSETAPPHLRGAFASMSQPCIAAGVLIASVVNRSFKNEMSKHSYQFQLVILYAIPLFLCVLAIFLPESPRWLAVQNRDDDAKKALRNIRGSNYKEEYLEIEMNAIKEGIRLEREISAGVSFFDIFKGTDLRRTILACACATMHASSGLNFLVGYSTVFFQSALPGSDAFTNSIILNCCGVIGSLMSVPLSRYFDRRPLLIMGFGIASLALLLTGIINEIYPSNNPLKATAATGKTLVAFVCIYQWAYGTSIGPLAWVVAGEFPSNRLRSMTFGFAMFIGFLFAWLTIFTTPRYLNILGARVAWIWLPSCFVSMLFAIFVMPETQGRNLEELDYMFAIKLPARKFKSFVYTNDSLSGSDLGISKVGVNSDAKHSEEQVEESKV